MNFQEIRSFTRSKYRIDMSWVHLETWLKDQAEELGLDIDPDYQRNYVWTTEQKSAYVEYILKNGMSGREIFWNCSSWFKGFDTPIEIVDGKQRLSAALGFLHNEVPAFDCLYKDFTGSLDILTARFSFHVNDLEKRSDVIQWYLDMNTGGSIHTEKDLARAREALAKELNERSF